MGPVLVHPERIILRAADFQSVSERLYGRLAPIEVIAAGAAWPRKRTILQLRRSCSLSTHYGRSTATRFTSQSGPQAASIASHFVEFVGPLRDGSFLSCIDMDHAGLEGVFRTLPENLRTFGSSIQTASDARSSCSKSHCTRVSRLGSGSIIGFNHRC